MRNKIIFLFTFIFLLIALFPSAFSMVTNEKNPQTVAESSQFTATSRYTDVIRFIHKLQKQSPLIRVETLCISPEGREVPLIIIGNPPPTVPSKLQQDTRAVIYIQANIHAGEVEGKEASLMLTRDIIQDPALPYLENLILLIAPIFNADGNEKIRPENRYYQAGPEQGVGVRYNGQHLDLNRDSIKLESPELQGLVQNVLMRWDPVLLVDCHTTNGSYHQEPVTYSWPLNPNGDASILLYMRDRMMPSIQKSLLEKYDTLSIPYGNYLDHRHPEKGWRTFTPHPRYVTNYVGLRNRFAILDENYVFTDYKTRVYSCYSFLRSILDYCNRQKNEIVQLVQDADRKTIQRGLDPSPDDAWGLTYDLKSLKDPIQIKSWEFEIIPGQQGRRSIKKTDREKTYNVPYYADFTIQKTIPFPFGYLILSPCPEVELKLRQHGIVVEKLAENATLEVEGFMIKDVKSSERLYQGHMINTVEGEYFKESREFPEGTLFVGTAQPLANLAVCLLEPESDDSLLTWNFFDRYLVPQWGNEPQVYPVFRILKAVNLAKQSY